MPCRASRFPARVPAIRRQPRRRFRGLGRPIAPAAALIAVAEEVISSPPATNVLAGSCAGSAGGFAGASEVEVLACARFGRFKAASAEGDPHHRHHGDSDRLAPDRGQRKER